MFVNANPLGFLTTSRAERVDQFIEQTETFVTELDLRLADIVPAREALNAAKALYAVHDFSEALAQAKRAGTLAVALNDRFNSYMAAWAGLQDCLSELQEIGYPTEGFEAAFGAAEEAMALQVEEDGALVPNYLGATALLERVTEQARALLAQAREASREVFLATLAVEALSEPQPEHAPTWLALRLDELIEQATRELALGHATSAHTLAGEARRRAEAARAGDVRAKELLEEAAVVLERLRAEGPFADGLADRIASARESIAKGFLDPTSEKTVVARLSTDVLSFAERYSRDRRVLERAGRVYARLRDVGCTSFQADESLSAARRCLGEGDWAGVRENLGRASQAFIRWRDERVNLARAITDFDQRVRLLKSCRLRLLPDVEEMLGRAKEELRSGRFSGANEDLLFATALMTQATRSGS